MVGFEGLYEVSSHGRVRSLTVLRQHGGYRPRVIPGKILKPKAGQRYAVFNLFSAEGIQAHRSAHRLVAEAFIPNPQGLPLVRHLDDHPRHNWADNLAWGTHTDNQLDACHNGRRAKRLTAESIRLIRLRSARGDLGYQIAQDLGVSATTISNILKGRIWRHA